MITNRWIASRKDNWSRLETLAAQAEQHGLKSLPTPDLRLFGILYRQAAADLSTARTDGGARTLEQYLNRLVARAHNFIYAGRRFSPRSVGRFFLHTYPRLFRKLFPWVFAAFLLFTAGGALGVIIALARPSFVHSMLGPQMIDTIEHHKMWTDSILGSEPEESAGIMTNNISVCFYSYLFGIVFVVPTLYFMVFNGLNIGVIATVCAQHGMSLSLWSFVAAHGALELPSIFISGGAGLYLGCSWLFPGFRRRRDALAHAGAESIRLLAGTVPLLIIAGTLEAFLSPQRAPVALKFSISFILLTALTLWLSEGWRRPRTATLQQTPTDPSRSSLE